MCIVTPRTTSNEKTWDNMKPRALITGASRGIGAAIAVELAAAGHPVILNYHRNHEAAATVKERIETRNGDSAQVELAAFDVADSAAAAAAIARLLQDPKPIGILINNAGVVRDGLLPMLDRARWEIVIRTTLDGFYNMTRPLIMPMMRRRYGRVINISSVSGIMGNPGQTNYAAAKAGLIGATKALAKEVARRSVTVNAIAPGLIETDMISEAPIDELRKLIPMRRLGQPQEVARLVAFLASEDAAYITGQVIGINGGLV